MDRVRLLYLSLHVGDCKQVLDSLGVGRAMSLRKLHLKKRSITLHFSAQMMKKIYSFAANITSLVLRNIGASLSSLTFPRLLHFSIATHDGFPGPRVSDVVGFIRGSPVLEVLDLCRVRCSYVGNPNTHIEPVTLQHLKSAKLGGRPSQQFPNALPYLEVDFFRYLRLPQAGERSISIYPMSAPFPRDTNHLLTLVHAWNSISGSGDGFGGGAGFTYFKISINKRPKAFTGQLEIMGRDNLHIKICRCDPIFTSSQAEPTTDWETITTDEDPGAGYPGEVSRLGRYLDPLRSCPSPLAALETLLLSGFGFTGNKGEHLQYLRECFRGLGQVRELQVGEMNLWMIAHLLRPFEDGSGGMVLLFPLLELLSFGNCTPAELPLPAFREMVKERAGLGNVLKTVFVDGERVNVSELWDTQERM